jgi:hypothetical protein
MLPLLQRFDKSSDGLPKLEPQQQTALKQPEA